MAETGGNPLGLLELARGMAEAELAGGFVGPRQASLPGQLQDHYLRRVRVLPEPARQLMLLAAADPTGDATLLWRAAQTLGLGSDAAAAAEAEQLLNIGSQVRFRHPLVRSAAYAAGSPEDRRAVHLALAAATDAQADPERRVWHLAAAATGPDEDVAAALEQAAAKIQARAGLAASAAFLQRSVALTAEPGGAPTGPWPQPSRTCTPARSTSRSACWPRPRPRGRRSPACPRGAAPAGRVGIRRGREAPVLLLQAARSSNHSMRARSGDLPARLGGVHLAGPLAGPGGLLLEVSRAAQRPRSQRGPAAL